MKGIICYYSGAGNTTLAIEYLARKIKNTDFELYNIVRNEVPDFTGYDVVGFASWADFGAPPKLMQSFMARISNQKSKNAFVFNTFGAFSLKTLKVFGQWAEEAGFNVVTGYSFHMPENYPPMRKMGFANDKAPKPKEMAKFDKFIADFDTILADIKAGNAIENRKLKTDFMSLIMPAYPRTKAKEDFGVQVLNSELCNECGVCFRGCPYEAITMDPKPVFNHDICAGCWYCYNNCKQKAITTPKFKGEHQYPKPIDEVKRKLKI